MIKNFDLLLEEMGLVSERDLVPSFQMVEMYKMKMSLMSHLEKEADRESLP